MTGLRSLPAARESRRRLLTRALTRLQSPRRPEPSVAKAVLFVSGSQGAAMRYRCDHRAEELRILGVSAEVAMLSNVDFEDVVDRYGCFVLHRVRFESSVGLFIEHAHDAGKRVIFDTDDLLFDSSVERYLPERASRGDGVRRQRETLGLCDAVTVTTAPLAERAANLHEQVLIEPNVVSSQMIALADAALERAGDHEPAEEVSIAYLSGSSTHDRDFLEAADAVIWALATYPDVRFVAIGPLTLDSRFEPFGERVERIPIQPWEALPTLLTRVSVNLAPLEGGNGFTECKSSIKYLEAGLLGVPTIASRRPDFVRVIEHGVNGFLAETPDEWREALSTLVQSSETRREIGRAAYEDVRRNHSTAARARAALETFRAIVGELEP